jgi:hypothetical protein
LWEITPLWEKRIFWLTRKHKSRRISKNNVQLTPLEFNLGVAGMGNNVAHRSEVLHHEAASEG